MLVSLLGAVNAAKEGPSCPKWLEKHILLHSLGEKLVRVAIHSLYSQHRGRSTMKVHYVMVQKCQMSLAVDDATQHVRLHASDAPLRLPEEDGFHHPTTTPATDPRDSGVLLQYLLAQNSSIVR